MKGRKRASTFDEEPKVVSTGRKITDLLRAVPTEQFVRMVTRSGLPASEARELCQAFKKLKQ